MARAYLLRTFGSVISPPENIGGGGHLVWMRTMYGTDGVGRRINSNSVTDWLNERKFVLPSVSMWKRQL